MRTFSSGFFGGGRVGGVCHESMTVMHPARPRNMSTHSTICEPMVSEGVMPIVRPTVAIAETTSKTASVTETPFPPKAGCFRLEQAQEGRADDDERREHGKELPRRF